MALQVVGTNGRSGQVIIKDERDDGAIVLLLCTPFDSPGGIAIPPSSDDQENGGTVFPWLGALQSRYLDTREPPFRLTVHTGHLSAGPQVFATNPFLARVFELADAGVTEVHLSDDDAEAWGHTGTDEA